MKYSSSNIPLVCMQTHSTCFVGTDKMTVKGVLWHSTGANNPNLKRYVQPYNKASTGKEHSSNTYTDDKWVEVLGNNTNNNDWNHIVREAGLNCWIGKLADGTITTVQTMPWDYSPWGCGGGAKGSCNDGWIQFEICEGNLDDKDYFNKVYTEACEITAYLCKLFSINPTGTVTYNGIKVPTILCHNDSFKLGLGSGHADVTHWFPKHGKTMDAVRQDVAALLSGTADFDTEGFQSPAVIDTTALAEALLIRKITIDSISSTKASIKLDVKETFKDYSWSYSLTKLKTNKPSNDIKITINNTNSIVEIAGLTPNNGYLLEVKAKDVFNAITKSPGIVFNTTQDLPSPVTEVTFNPENYTVSFKPPNSWGSYLNRTRGYRLCVFINGYEKESDDGLIKETSSSHLVTKNISSVFSKVTTQQDDLVQVGILPWVEDEFGNKIFANAVGSLSKPIQIQVKAKKIDKIFLNIKDVFKHTIIYNKN